MIYFFAVSVHKADQKIEMAGKTNDEFDGIVCVAIN